ncbi:hypothetical protein N9293_00415 [Planctomycetota bacterium]|nr:hypothetical protein [Planctomycetota bacterium]
MWISDPKLGSLIPLGAETQMLEDPARHERVGEGGDAVAAAAARGAAQRVHREGPLEEPTGSVGVQGDRRGGRRLAQGRVAEAAHGIDRFRALCAIVATTPYAAIVATTPYAPGSAATPEADASESTMGDLFDLRFTNGFTAGRPADPVSGGRATAAPSFPDSRLRASIGVIVASQVATDDLFLARFTHRDSHLGPHHTLRNHETRSLDFLFSPLSFFPSGGQTEIG